MITDQHQLGPKDIAQVLILHQCQPKKGQTEESFYQRVQEFFANNPKIKEEELNYYFENRTEIQEALILAFKQKTIFQKNGKSQLFYRQKASKLNQKSQIVSSNSSKTPLQPKKHWQDLLLDSCEIALKQLVKFSIPKQISIKNSVSWLQDAVICAVKIGLEFLNWRKQKITSVTFFENSRAHLIQGFEKVGKWAGSGATFGAAIGSFFGPIGTIIGIVVGGIVGKVAQNYFVKTLQGEEKPDQKYNQPKKLIQDALQYFDLPENFTPQQLQKSRLSKYQQYHPDVWVTSDEKTQTQKSSKLMKAHQFYELLANSK